MLSALLWYDCQNNPDDLAFAEKIASALVTAFGGDPHKLYACGALEQNCAILHSMALLYSHTANPAHVALCETILAEWQLEPAGDYLRRALAGDPFFSGSQPRWEGLMSIMGLAELYWATGTTDYSTAYQQIWWSLCQTERHNHGGLMSGEQATGSPYNTGSGTWRNLAPLSLFVPRCLCRPNPKVGVSLSLFGERMLVSVRCGEWRLSLRPPRTRTLSPPSLCTRSTAHRRVFTSIHISAVETCCTVTWSAMCVEMLKLTAASVVADELELTLFNTALLAESPSGRWCVYNSPMAGQRESTTIEIAFQARCGSSELSCCSVNGPRLFGLLCEWAAMLVPGGAVPTVAINYYGAISVAIPQVVTVVQTTTYPLSPTTVVTVTPTTTSELELWFRIPAWSERTTVHINDEPAPTAPASGTYLKIRRTWAAGDTVRIDFDFRLRAWVIGADKSGAAITSKSARIEPADVLHHCAAAAPAVPIPVWDSTRDGKWPATGHTFSGVASELVIIDPTAPAISNAPTTMMGWVATGPTQLSVNIPFSVGAGADATPNMSRAFALEPTNANYFLGGSANDLTSVIDDTVGWKAAMSSFQWHHIAVTDDGTTVTIYLDGKVVGSRPVKDPRRNTQGGFMVGGWADRNRYFAGVLSGVQLYSSAVSAADVFAAMWQSKPTGEPAFPTFVSLYQGPLLLGFDPRFNTKPTHAALPSDKASLSDRKLVTTDSWIQPSLLLKFPCPGGTSVTLCDCGSLGVTGLQYTTWLEMSFGADGPPVTSFTHANPTRTFFLE
jgi:hypothetical protein